MSATLSGTIAFQISVADTQSIVVRFFTPGTQTEKHKGIAPVVSGAFTIVGIPAGTYDVGVKSGGYMSKLVTDQTFTDGETTDIDFGTLKGGDINGDDIVLLNDWNITNANYGLKGDCYGYAGNWLVPQCPSPPPAGGACYGYITS